MNTFDSDAEKRLAVLSEYMVMDTPPEQAFDDLTRLTSFICGTPIALVTLLDKKRQWFKSKVGLSVSETPLEHAFCRFAIKQKKVLLVADTMSDERFSSNPLVTGEPHIRFYAGAPLITPEGIPLGTLCAIDRVPREMTIEQQEALATLARQVIAALELRKAIKVLARALAEKRTAERQLSELKTIVPMCAWCRKVRDDDQYWNHVEFYLSRHVDVTFTHGMCPECAAAVEKDILEKNKTPAQ